MIYVKFLFTGWKEVSKEQTLNFAKHIYKSSSALHSKDKIKYINDNYIKGIEFTENDLKEVCNVQSISKPVKNDRVDVVKKNNNLKSMEDNEWVLLDYGDDIKYQNKRCSRVFKDSNGKAYDIEGKIFSDNNGITWFTKGGGGSKTYITFPYTPKTEKVFLERR